jgi:hypothetical protein
MKIGQKSSPKTSSRPVFSEHFVIKYRYPAAVGVVKNAVQ